MSPTNSFLIGTDETSIELVKKAFVWYYRVWSYYWDEVPSSCVIHPAESFLELANEVVCFKPHPVTEEDVRRLQVAFAQPITFIAPDLPENQCGYILNQGVCQNASPWLERFLVEIIKSASELRHAVSNIREHERNRQEWRFLEAGCFIKYYDGKTQRIHLTPNLGCEYTFTVIRSTGDGLYFTESKKGPVGRATEHGSYRKHRHEAGRVSAYNLDFFSEAADPVLWRFVQAGRGFKAFVRKSPGIP